MIMDIGERITNTLDVKDVSDLNKLKGLVEIVKINYRQIARELLIDRRTAKKYVEGQSLIIDAIFITNMHEASIRLNICPVYDKMSF